MSDTTFDALKRVATQQDKKVSEVIREAIAKHLQSVSKA